MSARRLFLDRGPGEDRGVVTLDGRPERLLIERAGADPQPRFGARYRVRIDEMGGPLGLAFVDLGEGVGGVMRLKSGGPPRGAVLQAKVTAEARADKAAVLKLIGPADGRPGLLEQAPRLEQRLRDFAPGAEITVGAAAREAADDAQDAALAVRHALGDGLSLTVEPTRALVSVDVDLSPGATRSRPVVANLEAIRHSARLLRLKALGGTVVIDLVGGGRDEPRLLQEARTAFQPDQPGVVILPVSRLGLLQVARPHRERPVAEVLCDGDGCLSARSVAQRLIRALEREGHASPGALLEAACAADVAAELGPLIAGLGPRYSVTAALGWDRLKTDIRQR